MQPFLAGYGLASRPLTARATSLKMAESRALEAQAENSSVRFRGDASTPVRFTLLVRTVGFEPTSPAHWPGTYPLVEMRSEMVLPAGIEPATHGSSGRRSTS